MPSSFRKSLKFLLYFDFFQTPINLTFNKRKKNGSIKGVFFSIFIIGFLLMNFIQSDIFVKKSPYVVSQTLTYNETIPIFFQQNNLMVITVADAGSVHYIDPTIFQVTFDLYHLIVDDSGVFQIIDTISEKLKPCTIEDVFWDPSKFVELGLKNTFCLENKTFMLNGFWDTIEVYYAKAQIFRCDNETSNNTCQSPEEIDAFFESPKFFGAVFHGVSLYINDYQNPFKPKYQNIYQLIDLQIMKRFNVFLKTIDLYTDDGWFFSEITTQTQFLMDTLNTDFVSRSNNDPLSQILFYASHDSSENTRRYQTISEALASISGMGNFLFFLFFFVTSIQNHLNTVNVILNALYFFPSFVTKNANKAKKNKSKKAKLNIKEQNLNKNENTCHNLTSKETTVLKDNSSLNFAQLDKQKFESQKRYELPLQKNAIPQKIITDDSFILHHYSLENVQASQTEPEVQKVSNQRQKFKKQPGVKNILRNTPPTSISFKKQNNEYHPLNLDFWSYFTFTLKKICGCKKSKKNKIIRKVDKSLMKELDIVSILLKIHEIEKIKLILFNEDQLVLFDSISKPLLFFDLDLSKKELEIEDSSKKMSKMIKNYKLKSLDEKKIEESFKNLHYCLERDPMNERLLKLVNGIKNK